MRSYLLDFALNFDDRREYFVGAVVDIAAVAHVDDCIAVVAVKVEGRIAAVGALGDCIVVAYSLVGKAHHSKYGTQVAEAADDIVAEDVDNIVAVAVDNSHNHSAAVGKVLGVAYGDIVAIDAVVLEVELVAEFLVAVIVTAFQISLIFAFHYCLFSTQFSSFSISFSRASSRSSISCNFLIRLLCSFSSSFIRFSALFLNRNS